MSDLDTFPIRSRLAEVPPPPWGEFCESGDWWIQQKDDEGSPVGESICNSGTEDMTCAVATFIEHAPQDITDLLAEISRLRARLSEGEAIVAEGIERMQPLRAIYDVIQARRAKGGYCLCGFQGPTFHGTGCPVGAYEEVDT